MVNKDNNDKGSFFSRLDIVDIVTLIFLPVLFIIVPLLVAFDFFVVNDTEGHVSVRGTSHITNYDNDKHGLDRCSSEVTYRVGDQQYIVISPLDKSCREGTRTVSYDPKNPKDAIVVSGSKSLDEGPMLPLLYSAAPSIVLAIFLSYRLYKRKEYIFK